MRHLLQSRIPENGFYCYDIYADSALFKVKRVPGFWVKKCPFSTRRRKNIMDRRVGAIIRAVAVLC